MMNWARLGSLALLFGLLCGCNPGATATPPPPATATPTIVLPTPTPSPTPGLVAIPQVNLNVRTGPGTDYEVIGLLTAYSPVQIIAASPDGAWWQIAYQPAASGSGWVAAEYTAVEPVEPAPVAPPTAPLTATAATEQPAPTPSVPAGLTVTTPVPAPTFRLRLSLAPDTIAPGECARLRYEVAGVEQAQLNGQALAEGETTKPQSGSQVVCPPTSTVYTLSGLDQSGQSITETVTLSVLAATPTPAAEGGSLLVTMTAGCRFARTSLNTAESKLCRFSPDGQQIAAPAGDGSLWVVATDGSNFRQVFDPAGRFTIAGHLLWSPDGQAIAFNAVGLDGLSRGVGYFHLSGQRLVYLGPDAQQGQIEAAGLPRWTEAGQLVITWFQDGPGKPGLISLLTTDGPIPLGPETELQLSSGVVGQQFHPWQPGRSWHIGQIPSYEVD